MAALDGEAAGSQEAHPPSLSRHGDVEHKDGGGALLEGRSWLILTLSNVLLWRKKLHASQQISLVAGGGKAHVHKRFSAHSLSS